MDASRSLLDLLRPNSESKERINEEEGVSSCKGMNDIQSNLLSILMGKSREGHDKGVDKGLVNVGGGVGGGGVKTNLQSEYLSNLIESKNNGVLKESVRREGTISERTNVNKGGSSVGDRPMISGVQMGARGSPDVSTTTTQSGLLSILLGDSSVGVQEGLGVNSRNVSAVTEATVSSAVSVVSAVSGGGGTEMVGVTTKGTNLSETTITDEKTQKTMFSATNIFDQLSVTNPRLSDMKPKKILKAPPRVNDSGGSKMEEEGVSSLKNIPSVMEHFSSQKLGLKKEIEQGKSQSIRKFLLPKSPFKRILIPQAKNLGYYDKAELTEIARLSVSFDSLNNHTIDADKNYLAYAIPKDGNLRLMNQEDGSHVLLSGQPGSKVHDVLFSKYTVNPENVTYLMTTNSKGGVIVWHILKTSFTNPSKSVKMIFRFNGEHSLSNTEIKAKFCPIMNIVAIKLLNRIYFFRFSTDRFEEVQRSEISISNANIGFVVAEKFIEDFAFSPDGKVLVTIHEDGTAEFWSIYEHIENSIKFVLSTPILSYAVSNEPLFWVSFIGPKQPNAPSKCLIFGLRCNRKLYLLDLDSGLISQELILTGNSENSSSEISSIAIYDNSSQNLIVNDHSGFLYRFHYNNKDVEVPMSQDSYFQSLASKNTNTDISSKNWSLFDSFYVVSFITKKTLYNFNLVSLNDSALDLFAAHDKGYTILHFPVSKQEVVVDDLKESNIYTYTAQSVLIAENTNTTVKSTNKNNEFSVEQKVVSDVKFHDGSYDSKQEFVKTIRKKKTKNDEVSSNNKTDVDVIESVDINSSFNTLNIDDNSCNVSDYTDLRKFIKILFVEFNKQNKKIQELIAQNDEIRANQEKLLFRVSENFNNNIKESIEKNVSLSVKNNILPAISKFASNTTDKQLTQLTPCIKKLSQELTTEIHSVCSKFMDKTSLVQDISESLEKIYVKALNSEMDFYVKGNISQLQNVFQKISQMESKYDERLDFLLKQISDERKKQHSSIDMLLKNVLSLEKQLSSLLSKIDTDKLDMNAQNCSSKFMGDFYQSIDEVRAPFRDLLAKSHYNDVLAIWVQSPYKSETFDMFVSLDPKVVLDNASYVILFSVANTLSEIIQDIDDPLIEKKLQWLETCFKLLMNMESHYFTGITLQILLLIENRMDNLYERLRHITPKVPYLRIVLSILYFSAELRQFFNE
ncbi:hypothetical protein T552_04194 [Pneumocystis carinii B80]|uniref:EDC4-like protein pdc1 beta-propeller domain-containing protein n=1 Tax=Pneumocystis carinii (strain B80) TaxID=1408658 RepID=A0A0W4ZCT3_PNEC8|nr:hypothetical protein T552_04194 [Pneumocystis carinii B80]KTW26133.1 hypothetical protein T552_04194 [Pneumocystis carinii B80]